MRWNAGLHSLLVHGLLLAMRLGFTIVLMRETSPAVLGGYALVVSIDVIVLYVAGLEFHTFTARRHARAPGARRLRLMLQVHRRLWRLTAPAAAAIAIAAVVALALAPSPARLAAVATLTASGVIAMDLGRFLILASKPVASAWAGMIRGGLWMLPALGGLGADDRSLDAILGWWALGSVAACALAWTRLRELAPRRARLHRRYVMRGLADARHYYAMSAISNVQAHADRFVLQWLLGTAAVGVFSFFQTLAGTLSALSQAAILNVALPHLLQKFTRASEDRQRYLRHLMKRCGQTAAILSIGIVCVSVPAMQWLGKSKQYADHLVLLPLLLLAQAVLAWTQPLHLVLYAQRRDEALVAITCIGATFSLLASFGGIRIWGLNGAAAAALAGALLTAALRGWTSRHEVNPC